MKAKRETIWHWRGSLTGECEEQEDGTEKRRRRSKETRKEKGGSLVGRQHKVKAEHPEDDWRAEERGRLGTQREHHVKSEKRQNERKKLKKMARMVGWFW